MKNTLKKYQDTCPLRRGLTVTSTSYNNFSGVFSIVTAEFGEIKITCAGGANVAVYEEFRIEQPLVIKELTVEPYFISIGFGNNRIIELGDETGGETLEIYKA